MKYELGKLAKELTELADRYQESDIAYVLGELEKLKSELVDYGYEIVHMLAESSYAYENFTEEGLTLNALEAEGFRRAMLTMKRSIEDRGGFLAGVILSRENELNGVDTTKENE